MSVVIGWDIGGVHLKAARAGHGRIVEVVQVPSPLRLGLAKLADAFAQAKSAIGAAPRHAVTMTAELADTFTSRQEGVAQLAAIEVKAQDGPVEPEQRRVELPGADQAEFLLDSKQKHDRWARLVGQGTGEGTGDL